MRSSQVLPVLLPLLLLAGAPVSDAHQKALSPPGKNMCVDDDWRLLQKQPVIIDTDIGSFTDDSFAIVYAALSQELDVKLVVTCTDDTTARAKVTAKLLKFLGRDDIPIGIGIKNKNATHHSLFGWGAGEDLSQYHGGVFQDGVKKMAEVITESSKEGDKVDIIAIGPMTNFPELVRNYPDVVKKARIRAMAGSIYVGYDNHKPPAAEYNVEMCPSCMSMLLDAGWEVAITPLDTCGNVAMDGDQLKQMLASDSRASLALASTLMYHCIDSPCDLHQGTPIIYDAVGTLLTMPTVAGQFLDYAMLQLRVNGSGFTVIDDTKGVKTSVAISWKQGGETKFTDMLTKLYSV